MNTPEFLHLLSTEFCKLRAESVNGQLEGTIPSTSSGQSADSTALIDASDLNISDMGTMGSGGGFGGANFGGFGGKSFGSSNDAKGGNGFKLTNTSNTKPAGGNIPSDFEGKMPDGFDPSAMPNGEMPQGFDGNMPEGFTPPNRQGNTNSTETGDTNRSRPEMGSFPGNSGTTQKDMTTAYVLLGASAFVLLAGVAFALKFKR